MHRIVCHGMYAKASIGTPILAWSVDIISGDEQGRGWGYTSKSTSSTAPSPHTTHSVPAARLGVCIDSSSRSGCEGTGDDIGDKLSGELARSKRGSLLGVTEQLSSQHLFFGVGAGYWKISCAIIFCLTYACCGRHSWEIHQEIWKVLMTMNVCWLDEYLWRSLQVNDVSSFHGHQAAEERVGVEVVAHW